MCKISKRHKKILDAVSVLNKMKSSLPSVLRDEILFNKELILKYFIDKYGIEPRPVEADRKDYVSIVVDEINIGSYGFHMNLRQVSGFKGETMSRNRVNPRPKMSVFYAIKIVEDFKKRHNIF